MNGMMGGPLFRPCHIQTKLVSQTVYPILPSKAVYNGDNCLQSTEFSSMDRKISVLFVMITHCNLHIYYSHMVQCPNTK